VYPEEIIKNIVPKEAGEKWLVQFFSAMKKSYHVFSPKYSHAQNNNARYKQLH
jgi:hypothetical protein